MIRTTLTIGADDLAAVEGALVCRDLALGSGEGTIRRGTVVDRALRERLARHVGRRLVVVVPEAGELSQPEASERIARAVAGEGVRAEPPHQGQVILRAARPGLVRVRGDVVERINQTQAALLATSLDGRVVGESDTLAVVKAPSLWEPVAGPKRIEELTRGGATVRVASFAPRRAVFLVGERVRAASVGAAQASLGKTLESFGSRLTETIAVGDDAAAIAARLIGAIERGAEVVLVAGSIVLDPGDPFLQAIERLGGRIVCRGAPIDPGTMFWVAYLGSVACFGLASCEMYGRLSVLNLLLPYALAGEPIDQRLVASLGYGGLLDQTFAARRGDLGELDVAQLAGDEGEADQANGDAQPEGAEANEQRGRGGDGAVVGHAQEQQQAHQASLGGGEPAR